MATLKNTSINDTGHLTIPGQGANSAGSIRFNTVDNRPETFLPEVAGGVWTSQALPYLSRQIITTGYIHAGYASSVVFNNTNRTTIATDTTIDLTAAGQTQELGHNYKASFWSRDINYTIGGYSGVHCGTSSTNIAFNMRTEQSLTAGYTRNIPWNTNNPACLQHEYFKGWVSMGGTSNVYEWTFSNETLNTSAIGSNPNAGGWGTSHEHYGVWIGSGEGYRFNFATRQNQGGRSLRVQGDKHQHTLTFKHAYHIAGRESNPSTNWRETNMITDATQNAIGAKPAYSGEENTITGQDWGYGLGWYQGSHVNTTYKFTYATRAGINTGSSTRPKGVAGQSSATMSWRD